MARALRGLDCDQQDDARQYIKRHHQVHAVGVVAGVLRDKSVDRRTDRGAEVAQAADQRNAGGGRRDRQIFGDEGEEQRRCRRNSDDRE